MRPIFLLFFCVGFSGLQAAPTLAEEVEFSFEPSFHEGTVVRLHRTADGRLSASAYTLTIVDDSARPAAHKNPLKLIKEVAVSDLDFAEIVRALESPELRAEAESSDQVGVDGSQWIFRRRFGGRFLELRFWTPEMKKGSSAYALATKFAAAAKTQNFLPKESTDVHGDIPIVVPDTQFRSDKK